jgi:serine/threonine protein kinase
MTKCADRGPLAYSFLEYVPGGSVGSCLRKHGKFGDNVVRSFTAQILEGLEYLHSKNILHRVGFIVVSQIETQPDHSVGPQG